MPQRKNLRTLRVAVPHEVADRAERHARGLHERGELPGVGDGVNELGALLGLLTEGLEDDGGGAVAVGVADSPRVAPGDLHDMEAIPSGDGEPLPPFDPEAEREAPVARPDKPDKPAKPDKGSPADG